MGARRTNIRSLNDMETAQKLAKEPRCVNFRVFDGQVSEPKKQIEVAAAQEQNSWSAGWD